MRQTKLPTLPKTPRYDQSIEHHIHPHDKIVMWASVAAILALSVILYVWG